MRVCRLVRKPASSTSPRRRAQGSQLGHRHASDEDDNVGGTPSRRPQCRTAEQAIRRMSEEAPGDPGRHLVDALVSISPDRGRLPTDRRPTRRRKDSAVDVPLGCPLPAVLPAVSRSVRRFLTPAEPLGFPNECGVSWGFRRILNGFEARHPRHVKPLLGSLHGRQHLRRREHTTGSAGPESRFTHRSRPTSASAHRSHDAVRLDAPFPDENLPAVDPARRYGLRRRAARLLMEAIDELPPPMLPGDGPAAFRLSEPPLGVPGHELDVDLVREREYRPRQVNRTTLRRSADIRSSPRGDQGPENQPSAAPVPTLSRIQRADDADLPLVSARAGVHCHGAPELLTLLLTFGAPLGRFAAVSDRF